MPVYNGARYINYAIDSILSQTFTDFELIIVNDASTDETVAIISAYNDTRIRLVCNEKNIGITGTRNKGISSSRGEYIAMLDSDDIALPTRLEVQVRFLIENKEFGMVGTRFESIDSDGNTINKRLGILASSDEFPLMLLFRNYFAQSTVMIRKSILPEGHYRNFEPAEDYDLWIRIACKSKVWNIPKVLVKYRIHNLSVTYNNSEIQENCVKSITNEYLSKLNVIPTDSELIIHRNIAKMTFDASLNMLFMMESWLIKLNLANNYCNYFDNETLEKVLANEWYHICRKAESLGFAAWRAYWRSEFSRKTHIKLIKKIIFAAMCGMHQFITLFKNFPKGGFPSL